MAENSIPDGDAVVVKSMSMRGFPDGYAENAPSAAVAASVTRPVLA